jgi:hypothetical protein
MHDKYCEGVSRKAAGRLFAPPGLARAAARAHHSAVTWVSPETFARSDFVIPAECRLIGSPG